MNFFYLVLINVLTLGCFNLWVKNKKKTIESSPKIKAATKLNFSVDGLISCLGGKENILDISNTISTIKVNLKNNIKINKSDIKQFNVTGIITGNNCLTLVIGDYAQKTCEEIQKKLR